ncbi:hypothetical protein [Ktedonobacter racemifer]|uniref:Coagulation factor 5/8 type n=1 Tax=Ktedonobacter racemifer DSM 44963 TaxID=485913 RepID=D6TSB9_KTERA|nr:hypothetical protein [Ktedonobacter racemifer]EFH83320.1 coagulation factor 5/8 type [Ktedonobacter racemifer DSM 44963]
MGMQHKFWLLREDQYTYTVWQDLASQCDAPVSLHEDILRYFFDSLQWIPTLNPAKPGLPTGYGLNWWGPTIINQTGGSVFYRVWSAWSQLLSCGPEKLRLQGAFTWQWPFPESEHLLEEDQIHILGCYETLDINRDELISICTTFAGFGEQAATGEFFILHEGI